jgi:hypothetical protein
MRAGTRVLERVVVVASSPRERRLAWASLASPRQTAVGRVNSCLSQAREEAGQVEGRQARSCPASWRPATDRWESAWKIFPLR